MESSLLTDVAKTLYDHWLLLVALGAVVKWGLPYALKAYFANGGGDMMRAIVKSENIEQSRSHREELDRRMREHEVVVETPRFQAIENSIASIRSQVDNLSALAPAPLPRSKRRGAK